MEELLNLFPFIQKSKDDFEHQTKLLNKVTLTGKINSNKNTNNLFEFTEQTSENFIELKNKLIQLLFDENIDSMYKELNSKASICIDILIRNLFERTADVGFLATDTDIIDFLNGEGKSKEELQKRLYEYVLKYSVYNEVIVFDTSGKVMVNLNPKNRIEQSHDKIIKDTLKSDDYIERYAHTDIFKGQEKTLVFTQKIQDKQRTLGVLCLCFKFNDELKRIFEELDVSEESLLLVEKSKVISSSNIRKFPLKSHVKLSESKYDIRKGSMFVSSKATAYQGYKGLNWSSVAVQGKKNLKISDEKLSNHCMNPEVKDIIEKADNIVEDLSDIIINGELIAAKQRMYLLNPILDNLRIISVGLLETIKLAGENLESLVDESLKFNLISSSKLAIDIMDRNLYERANDSRWWALTPLFIKELSSDNPDELELTRVLSYINELYTVYTNIFIYDKNSTIVASSNDSSIVGKSINCSAVSKTLSNRDTQKYFVSDFAKSEFYGDEATYIYHASISNESSCVGGIGVVFDSSCEFKAILEDSLSQKEKIFALFIDTKGEVIASTNPDVKINSLYPLSQETLKNVCTNETYYTKVTINEKSYLLASALSKGYREYKTSDNYENRVISLVLKEL